MASSVGQLRVNRGTRRNLLSASCDAPQWWGIVVEVDPIPSGSYVALIDVSSSHDQGEFVAPIRLTITGNSARQLVCVWGRSVSVDVENITSTADFNVTAAAAPVPLPFPTFADQF